MCKFGKNILTQLIYRYPAVYVILTLPIAVGRMVAMTGKPLPEVFYLVAGALLTSCGWIDALLYTLTRRVLVSGDLSTVHYNRTVTATLTNAARPGDGDQYGLHSLSNKEAVTSTARTVTIIGGSNRLSRIVDHRRGRSHATRSRHEDTLHDDDITERSGSQDSIIKAMPTSNGINIVTETNIQVESASDQEFDDGKMRSKDWGEGI
jgi:hypothetical protein